MISTQRAAMNARERRGARVGAEVPAELEACVEINEWNAPSSKNFKPLHLEQIG